MLPPEYQQLQRTIRQVNREYARTLNWCRNPQNNDDRLSSVFKPRIQILVRPPIVKTGLERSLHAGRGEIIYHVPGTFRDSLFVIDETPGSATRIIVGEHSPGGLIEFIDDKLLNYSPVICTAFLNREYCEAVRAFYAVTRESMICRRAHYS